jgi:hypothetical protein
MRVRLGAAIATAITISAGFVTILGLLLTEDMGIPAELVDTLSAVAGVFLQLVTITAALLVLLGIVNLLSVHGRRAIRRRRGLFNSVVLLVSFALVIGAYITERGSDDPELTPVLLDTVLISIESALAGLLFFALVYGAYRLMHRRVTWSAALFLTALLLVLVGALPFTEHDVMGELRDWLLETPVSGGARGILIGIALATLVTGVRVLIGQDRSYRE